MAKIPAELVPALLRAVNSKINQLETVACAETLRRMVFESTHKDARTELEQLKILREIAEYHL